jgi:hypothetical protein
MQATKYSGGKTFRRRLVCLRSKRPWFNVYLNYQADSAQNLLAQVRRLLWAIEGANDSLVGGLACKFYDFARGPNAATATTRPSSLNAARNWSHFLVNSIYEHICCF